MQDASIMRDDKYFEVDSDLSVKVEEPGTGEGVALRVS